VSRQVLSETITQERRKQDRAILMSLGGTEVKLTAHLGHRLPDLEPGVE
jgi:hypothetical protein